MRRRLFQSLLLAAVLGLPSGAAAQNPHLIVYEGDQGPGRGKHIVFLAGDHEYRSEESLPALARIMARHYGFKCSVFFTTNPQTGFIEPGSSNIAGLEALRTADLMVVFLRFQDFPDAEMQHIADYLDRGGPVVGFRTATHAFQIKRPDAKFVRFDWQNKGDFAGGFGRQILGETWVSHYGTNHKMSSRLLLEPSQASHPVLRGVKDVWVQSGGYTADPLPPSVILARGQILNGMTPDSPPAPDKKQMPVAWVRYLLVRVGQDRAGVHDHARRVGGSVERRVPADGGQRVAVGGRAREQHHGRRQHQPGRAVSADDVQLQRLRQGREAGRHGRLGHADSTEDTLKHASKLPIWGIRQSRRRTS